MQPGIDLTRRRRPEGCLSDLVLDRLVAGEPPGRDAAAVAAHLDGCAMCAARLAELERAREEMAPLVDELRRAAVGKRGARPGGTRATRPGGTREARPDAAKTPWRWLALAAPALAAAVLLVLLVPRLRPRAETREKGGAVPLALDVVVRDADGRVAPLPPDGRVHPGDRIRFVVSAAHAGQLVILGLDAAGQVTPYVADGDRARPLPRGAGQVMPGSILLDGTLGAERLVAVACDAPFAVADAVDAARRQLERAARDPRRAGALGLGGCHEAAVLLNKSERP